MSQNNYLNLTGREIVERGGQIKTPERVRSDEAYKRIKNIGKKELGFTMLHRDNFNSVKFQLELGEAGLLMFLAGYLRFDTGGSLYYKGERITNSIIAKLVKKSERQVRAIIGKLESYGFINKVKEGRKVFVNLSEGFFVCGYTQKKFMSVKIYKEALKEVAQKVSLNELGLLVLILGHMHFKTHVLCNNPDEQEVNKVILWKRKDLINELSLSKEFVYKAMKNLKSVRAIVEVSTVQDGIVLHPNLVCRQVQKPSWDSIVNTIENGLTKDNYKK